MIKWWDTKDNHIQKVIFQAIPNVILWYLWKMRNTLLHGGKYSISNVIRDITITIRNFMKLKFKDAIIPNTWDQIMASLDAFKPEYHTKVVITT